jgi:hypothetical protein
MRIRNKPGSTLQARRHFHKCARIGNIVKVEAVRYTAMFKGETSKFPITNEVIRVTGTHGTVRLMGLCHGYGGEGPRGLKDLLLFLGLKQQQAELVAFKIPRLQVNGIDWKLEFTADDGTKYVTLTCPNPEHGTDGVSRWAWEAAEAMNELLPYTLLS